MKGGFSLRGAVRNLKGSTFKSAARGAVANLGAQLVQTSSPPTQVAQQTKRYVPKVCYCPENNPPQTGSYQLEQCYCGAQRPVASQQQSRTQQVQPQPRTQQVQPQPRMQQVQPQPRTRQVQPQPRTQQVQPQPRTQQIQRQPRTQQVQGQPRTQGVQQQPRTQGVQQQPRTQQVQGQPRTQQVQRQPRTQRTNMNPESSQFAQKAETQTSQIAQSAESQTSQIAQDAESQASQVAQDTEGSGLLSGIFGSVEQVAQQAGGADPASLIAKSIRKCNGYKGRISKKHMDDIKAGLALMDLNGCELNKSNMTCLIFGARKKSERLTDVPGYDVIQAAVAEILNSNQTGGSGSAHNYGVLYRTSNPALKPGSVLKGGSSSKGIYYKHRGGNVIDRNYGIIIKSSK